MTLTATRFFQSPAGRASPEVEDRFFTDLRTRNATFKRTGNDRFHDLDEVCVRCFADADVKIGKVLDVGISSGTTTLALSDRLHKAGHPADVIGTDLSVDGHLVTAYPGVRVLTDEVGYPLQYDVLGMVLRPWRRRADYATGMVLVRAAANAWIGRRAKRLLMQGKGGSAAVQLVSPRVSGHPHVRVEKNDIFADTAEFRGRFDFIRAANILNRGYFDEDQLRKAMANVVRYLAGPGAWLLVARSTKGQHVGTLFRVSDDGRYMNVVDRYCGGSEVEWLVLETPLPAEWAK
ncbi:MAG: hypothetical protein QHC67_07200 [Sphingobium sp.]|uniref:hypothetical protein n=1 Tax=Sphingobium sp. TaxID=1912891 RepID=UPI0029B54507|nr:hypothetical protein [Sphingobium sp.]MDX3909592.1 hypothetical protein [Sphingobium sp.]